MSDGILMKCGCVSHGVITRVAGKPIDPPIPSCFVHDCTEPAESKPDLTGRQAQCSYRHTSPSRNQRPGKSPVPSSFELPFFVYQGQGSREATEMCKCGYHRTAHEKGLAGRCKTFTAKGPQQFDKFYCGCMGWN